MRTLIKHPLDTLVSARIRLTEEERTQIKDAYYDRKRSEQSIQHPETIGGSPIKVVNSFVHGTVDAALGMSHLVFTDLVNSRDSIAVPVILKVQTVLGLEIVTKKRITAALKDYLDYVWESNQAETV